MTRSRFWLLAAVLALGGAWVAFAHSQPPKPKSAPRLEPVADTKLLMEGLASPNSRALGKLLAARPKEDAAWNFARGQALLLAELGNLLLMRPPPTGAADAWSASAVELRERAAALGRAAAAKDYLQTRASLAAVANACNRCHQSARVKVRVDPFADQ
jgi:hypothetical protein